MPAGGKLIPLLCKAFADMKGAEQRSTPLHGWTCHRYTLCIYVLFVLCVSYTLFNGSLSFKSGPFTVVDVEVGKKESRPQDTDWDAMLEKLGLAGILLDPMQSLLMDKARLSAHLGTQSFTSYVRSLEANSEQANHQRGILITAGGRDMLANALITIRILRQHLHCDLPVEIVYYGAKELEPVLVQLLRHENTPSAPVYLVDGLNVSQPEHHTQVEIKGFATKVYSLCYVTRFREVLMLDADSMPLVHPDQLFGSKAFARHGNLFWPDFWHNAWVEQDIYTTLGMSKPPWHNNPQHRLVDSGQVLIDRLQHAEMLEWLWLLNSHTEVVYKKMHGDKDTYKLAFFLAGKIDQFEQVPVPARDAMREVLDHEFRYHHLGMIQALPEAPDPTLPALESSSANNELSKTGIRGNEANSLAPTASNGTSKEAAIAAPGTGHLLTTPAIFHRTSFNSKFFPDCLRAPFPAYCQVQLVSVPLTSDQAGHSLKPHMFAFKDSEIDATAWQRACANLTGYINSNSSKNHNVTVSSSSGDGNGFPERTIHGEILDSQGVPSVGPPEERCSFDAGKVPIPVLPVELHRGMLPVLQASYKAYADLRKELNVRRARRLLMPTWTDGDAI